MRHSTSIYYIEALTQGKVKLVPHEPGSKNYEYLDRGEAVKYMKGLVAANQHLSFRLCRRVEKHIEGPWEKFKK